MKNCLRALFTVLLSAALCMTLSPAAHASGLTLITATTKQNGGETVISYNIISSEITSESTYVLELWRNTVTGLTSAECVYSATATGLSGTVPFSTEGLDANLYYAYIVVTYNGYSTTSNPVPVYLGGVEIILPGPTSPESGDTTPEETDSVPGAELRITKSPTAEAVEPGGDAYFIAAAENYSRIEWRIVDASETECLRDKEEIETRFPGVSFNAWSSDDGREYLHLVYIPELMNGYLVQAKFWSLDGSETAFTDAQKAAVTVDKAQAEPTPALAEETPLPTEAPAATNAPTEVTPTPAQATSPVRVTQDPTVSQQRQNASVAMAIAALSLVTIACGIYLFFRKNPDRD